MTKPSNRRHLIEARDRAVSGVARARGKLNRPRRLPDFIVAGVQKGGTTFLFQEMLRHPDVRGSLTKEVHFFDLHFYNGLEWYRGMFPPVRGSEGTICGEASPSYIFDPLAVGRIAEALADPRLIIILRNPIDRAWSHYQHERRLGFEPCSTFEEAISLEDQRVGNDLDVRALGHSTPSFAMGHFTYTRRGLYADQLRRAAALVGRERLLVLFSEEMFEDPIGVTRAALDFVGARSAPISESGPNDMSFHSEPMQPQTRKRLGALFADPNADLAEFLGRPLPW